ncbi:MAG: flavodoxin-dependent (E)-4-hydroxy-3-methylbut-2-enyl-diphosphate synthase [Actinobacteria bacterium]|nr:flavodoxin-dependent (E)-4-hydroxy-3-methylbut-2-enyl-diphosphate synthase [Actinomycetota bacterium]MBU4482904.1 flavodoxin-dependent (E)-4-hydroxy-3-methylbut-2-enyl-diphosphate synthase [Actinomycetota bacterium]
MQIKRKKTRIIQVGKLKIGGSSPIIVQSMTKSKLEDLDDIRSEIKELIGSGCELIRIAIPEKISISYLKRLIDEGIFSVPAVADIQFDYRLALECMDIGVDGIRINPGNIGGHERVGEIVEKAKKKKIAVRIGINSGSIDKKILKENNGNIVNSMVESALENVRLLESLKFKNFKISAKASSVLDTINVYELVSNKVDYPLHLGVTEAGPKFRGSIKSSVGIGILLSKGIGDTIRVSLTGKSIDEVKAAYIILNSLGLRKVGVDIISCPTCGRTTDDLEQIVDEIEKLTADIKKNLKLAVMGCIVNGPGEAKDADLGIAFGKDKAAVFLKGRVIKRVDKNIAAKELKKELERLV